MYSSGLNIDNNNNNKMFLEQQIRILEWFLKDHVTNNDAKISALKSQE